MSHHRHICVTCRAELRCDVTDPDRCPIGSTWQCAACELDTQDHYFTRLEETEHEHQPSVSEQVPPRR